jgi:hypothetical protein
LLLCGFGAGDGEGALPAAALVATTRKAGNLRTLDDRLVMDLRARMLLEPLCYLLNVNNLLRLTAPDATIASGSP